LLSGRLTNVELTNDLRIAHDSDALLLIRSQLNSGVSRILLLSRRPTVPSRARTEVVRRCDSVGHALRGSPSTASSAPLSCARSKVGLACSTHVAHRIAAAAVLAAAFPLVGRAQTAGDRVARAHADSSLVESDSFTVFRRELEIGVERYELRRDGDGLALRATILASARGASMPVDATVRTDTAYALRSLRFRGAINAWARNVDRSIDVVDGVAVEREGARRREVRVPARWYSLVAHVPASAQELLLRYWLAHGRPDSLARLDGGAIAVRDHGTDTLATVGVRVALRRYSIGGVTWGREVLWLDDSARVYALTANTSGIAYQFVRRGHEDALPRLVELALADQFETLAELRADIQPLARSTVAIVGGRVIDATGRPPIDDGIVLVRDGRIVAVGRRSTVRVPHDATVIDARGRSVLPGLWDMHAHYGNVEWGPAYLGGGVTTVRDLGNVLEFETALRDSLNSGRALGPRMLLAGLVDGPGPDGNGKIRASTPAEARAVVKLFHNHNFQQIKLYNIIPPALVPVFTSEAHRFGMTVTGHVPRGMDAVQAVNAGMDGLEHIHNVMRVLVQPESLAAMQARGTPANAIGRAFVPTADAARRTARLFVERGTVIDPTLGVLELMAHGTDLRPEALEPGLATPPQGLESLALAFVGQPSDTGDARKHFLGALAAVRALHAAGVTIVAGTDVAVPVYSLHHELELLVRAGFTPMEAIQAATIVPARVMGVERDVGTLERGKRADLIVVDGDPLRDISNIRRIRQVMTGGWLYDTALLWRTVAFHP
jgi:imidazolonepropionase-like amidohydrolase